MMKYPTIKLVADGLDTVASLTLNGRPIGSTNNMFRRYSWNVKSMIKVKYDIFTIFHIDRCLFTVFTFIAQLGIVSKLRMVI